MLNGSGLAIGRTMAAILENGLQTDGSVKILMLLFCAGSDFIKSLVFKNERFNFYYSSRLSHFFHEMGHFLAAILQGIYVDGFSIGFGPLIIQKKYKNTAYSFRAFPLGGFVSFPDEGQNNIDPKDPNLLKNRPIIQRVIVISAEVG